MDVREDLLCQFETKFSIHTDKWSRIENIIDVREDLEEY